MDLLVVGSVALDSLEGGTIVDVLGGSALYFALAASRYGHVSVSAPVGPDAAARVRDLMGRHARVNLEFVEELDVPTYRWYSDQIHGHTVDLGSRDEIYDHWVPRLPADFSGWAFLGSMRPSIQLEAAHRLSGCSLLAADAMFSYLADDLGTMVEVASACDWFFCTDEELHLLGFTSPDEFRAATRLQGLVVKRGPEGATVLTSRGVLRQPAVSVHEVDPTGAGDTFAGAMLGRWAAADGAAEQLPVAVAEGARMAALTVSGIGLSALLSASE